VITIASHPRMLRRILERATIVFKDGCVRIEIEAGIDDLLSERGLLHGASLAALCIIASEYAISSLAEAQRYIAVNTFINFIRQVSEPNSITIESCIESTTAISASVTTYLLVDGIEAAKSTTLFLKIQGE